MPQFQGRIGQLRFPENPLLKHTGYGLILLALIIGLAALFEMRNSWRVGIRHNQKTELVTTGIYSISRHPYFLSYDLLFIGMFLIYPSIALMFLIMALIVVSHLMIKGEENHLEKVQGKAYQIYREKVARYILFF